MAMTNRAEKHAQRNRRIRAVMDYWDVNETVAGKMVADWYRGKSNRGRHQAQEAIADAGLV